MKRRIFLLLAAVLSFNFLIGTEAGWSIKPPCVYVQATHGSFNHEAVGLLLQNDIIDGEIHFCGTPLNTFTRAFENQAPAFVAIKNTTIPGHFVEATIKALHDFQLTAVICAIQMKIEMAHLRHQDAVANHLPLGQVASHPAALMQISNWLNAHPDSIPIEIHEGTGEAARQLAFGEIPVNSSVIGPKSLTTHFPNLVVVEENIQDSPSNATTFILAEPGKRTEAVTDEEIWKELNALLITYPLLNLERRA